MKLTEQMKRHMPTRRVPVGMIEEKIAGGMVEGNEMTERAQPRRPAAQTPEEVIAELYPEGMQAPNKYRRLIKTVTTQSNSVKVTADVYDILEAWNVSCPATQHAIKKLLQPGARGHKDTLQDLREAIASIERAIELEEARNANA